MSYTDSVAQAFIGNTQAAMSMCPRHGGLLGACPVCKIEFDSCLKGYVTPKQPLTHEDAHRATKSTIVVQGHHSDVNEASTGHTEGHN